MKIDVNQHLTLGAKRTLKAFRIAMFEALGENEFDKITVNDICQKSEYPRATFYNYFDDKLDLLQYLWSYIGHDIFQKLPDITRNEDGLIETFNLLLDFFHNNKPLLENLKKSNGVDSHLWHNTAGYLKREANEIIVEHCLPSTSKRVPAKLLARFYSDLIVGMLEWCLFEQPDVDKETADKYLTTLLHGGL
ncbi:TetR/AcrR family transcriptional regulator [Companilactobacillus zhachilii]|uniref:TetR/AcrR family transcriptional regulator n=1 Tax=Companilactobacillus zhachilii TaxID=2304606 RepID=UPI0019249E89|nr:TetR/AcrR family transcriptional regulator [Companilactobacillus zhachilii]MBL3531494.1 TetR/AcrR family transcriptional regulator [Companilactobacillus zhachilii]